jgi:hypothetical protein
MTRLQSELDRLYLLPSPAHSANAEPPSPLIGPSSQVRAMVVELTRPPSWEVLSKLWRGMQTELDLPAPAIAVSGTDGLQLWCSLAEPISASTAHAFLERLRARFLPDIDTRRIRLMPAADASAAHPERHARLVPALQEATGNWSAFVAADLAPVFGGTPWLDIPPGEEGQATLLHGLRSITPAALDEALKRLGPGAPAMVATTEPTATTRAEARPAPPQPLTNVAAHQDAERFLRDVMNDESVALALRIEAAKALLQHAVSRPPSPAR